MYDENNEHEDCRNYPTPGEGRFLKNMKFGKFFKNTLFFQSCSIDKYFSSDHDTFLQCDDEYLHEYFINLDLCDPFWILTRPGYNCSDSVHHSDQVNDLTIGYIKLKGC